MPLYEYECPRCGETFEAITRITDKDETECPECGSPAVRQLTGFAVLGETVAGKGKRCYTGG
ncbi:MAG: zinc ribbon domain-containing protein [Proteobacteria bacterium]|jgi:putative FmdB family regulatory protein|nr:zinc ribbon domain-containing protein [Pseudomonadota bacterium]